MITESMREEYARLVVRAGINVRPGQEMLIEANARDYLFVRKCVREAYAAGASRVSVELHDDVLNRMKYENEPDEMLCEVPQWVYDREKFRQDRKTCSLTIYSDTPGLLSHIPDERIQKAAQARAKKMKPLRYFYMKNKAQWCVISQPNEAWAKLVFPGLDAEEACRKLEEAIYDACRVKEGEDALKTWEAHDEKLRAYAETLNRQNFRSLHFKSLRTGTDLTVGLVKDHIWVGGSGTDESGTRFSPNIPTEEVFTMPSRTRVEGVAASSRVLEYHGKLIEDFRIRFENGRAVDCSAKKEQALLEQLLSFDEGSRHLGEVALVPHDSPISRSGLLFYNTLFDENAACHLALGRAYPENIKGGAGMEPEELMACDGNDSLQHIDFMIGTEDLEVDGITEEGGVVPVFRNGNYVPGFLEGEGR